MPWCLDTRDKPGLLWAILDHFNEAGSVSFEGNLKPLQLETIPGANLAETPVLKRVTEYPVQDFVVVPINSETTRALKRILARSDALNDWGLACHTQVEHQGKLVLGAYDGFHRNCVIAYEPVPDSLLDRLVAVGTLRSYEVCPEGV